MKRKFYLGIAAFAVLSLISLALVSALRGPELIGGEEDEENEMYDGAQMAAEFEIKKTRDLTTGRVPKERLIKAIDAAENSKANARRRALGLSKSGENLKGADRSDALSGAPLTADASLTTAADGEAASALLSWAERGPDRDVTGPSNGNLRANSGVASGRIRAIAVDPNDPTGRTVLAAGIDGGIWKTTDVSVAAPAWTPLNDFLTNLAVSDIAFDPRPGFTNIAYAATGESYYNSDAVRGVGVFKSIDGGNTWAFLPATASFLTATRIVVDGSGNVYLATRDSGLRRSSDGGTTWSANISPSGLSARICDMELSSTGRLHVVTGIFSTQGYRYTDAPAAVSSATWTAPVTPFPSYAMRAEIASSGNTLYAAPANGSYQVPTMYRSDDGGANWTATAAQPAGGQWSSQGWYALAVGVNPVNPLEVMVGGLDTYRSLDGGATWVKTSNWVGSTGEYVHADVHNIKWAANGSELLVASDGGVFYSADKGTTFRDRNTGLRIKQFYSVAMHPTTTDYFLAGAQDNGTHQLTTPGLGSSVEVTGGDGAFVAIDQDQPQYQFGAYVYNQYRRSTNGGTNWTQVNLSSGTGQFINPFEYDNSANIIYAADTSGSYRRWLNPQTGSTSSVVAVTGMSGTVSAVSVSPATPNRIYLGTDGGKVFRIDSASTAISPVTGTDLTAGLPGFGYVSNIGFGATENDIVVTISNYGMSNVWVSSNGGANWTAVDGNLPDMPIRWATFKPGAGGIVLATEAGVWETDLLNGALTVWTADPTFPTVRVDMVKYRPSDGLYAAATHGRGLWTTVSTVSISGRVVSFDGRGLKSAPMTLTMPDGSVQNTTTGPKGFYHFDNLIPGRTYVIAVHSRRYTFTPQTVTPTQSLTGVDFHPVS